MKNLYAFLFVFTTCFINNWSAQETRFQLIDEINNIPVKYANIKAEKGDFGTSSDSLGNFTFDRKENIIINAVGYELKSVNLESASSKILLAPKETTISEVIIQKPKNKNETIIDSFRKKDIKISYGLSDKSNSSWIIGNYFENKSYKTKFLKSISVFTNSKIDNAKFNVRIYSVDENNEPLKEIYQENIIGIAKKGRNFTTIDLSKTNLLIPENGIFIAIDWIKTQENRYEVNYTIEGKKGHFKNDNFAPLFGCIVHENSKKTQIFMNNHWGTAMKYYFNEKVYSVLAMELILTD